MGLPSSFHTALQPTLLPCKMVCVPTAHQLRKPDPLPLYQKRLGFGDITPEEVAQLGYDQRYCGFKHTTSPEEINIIRAKQIIFKDDSKEE